jgi:hypothetical protein
MTWTTFGPWAAAYLKISRKGETGLLSLKVVHMTDTEAGKAVIAERYTSFSNGKC